MITSRSRSRTITAAGTARPPRNAFGGWVSGNANTGLRNQAYGGTFSGTYGSLGKNGFENDHDAGTVWCQALLDVNEVLGNRVDAARGDELGWQIVFDSLRLLHPGPEGPTFLHARDAVLSVLDRIDAARLTGDQDDLKRGVWKAFAKRGMGPAAVSGSAGFTKIKEDRGGA